MWLSAATIVLLAPLVHSQAVGPIAPAAPAPAVTTTAPAVPAAPAVPPAPVAPVTTTATAADPVAPAVAPAVAAPPNAVPVAPGNVAPGGGAPIATANPGQVPPVTAVAVPSTLPNGQITQVQVIFTQSFASVPDQLPTPSQGSIGMGTLTGTVGAVRTEQAKKAAGNIIEKNRYWAVGVAAFLLRTAFLA